MKKTPRKIWKSIAEKLKNRKGSQSKTTLTRTAMEELRDSDMPEDVKEVKDSPDVGEHEEDIIHIVDKATETNTKLCEDTNINSEDLQPICKTSEKAQNASTEQKPNAPESPPPAEPCSRSGKENPANEKSSTQPIVAGIVGVLLLASGVASYIMKMHIIAVVGGIVGLAWIGFVLHNVLKPNTKLEKLEDVEQAIIDRPLIQA